MKKHPRITIVTACYNSEAYLEDCIKSILNQTYDNIEHIIISMVANDLFELFKGLLICKPFYFFVWLIAPQYYFVLL